MDRTRSMTFDFHRSSFDSGTDNIYENETNCPTWGNSKHFGISTLSFSDTRKLAAVRAKENQYEVLMNTQRAFEQGYFPGGYRHVGMVPPLGLLSAFLEKDLDLVERSWNYLLKNTNRHGIRLMVHCLRGNEGGKKVLKLLKTKTRVAKTQDLYRHPLAVHYGRRLITAIATVIANVRNDNAIKAYIHSLARVLQKVGLKKTDMEELGGTLPNFVETVLGSVWTEDLMDAWETFVSEILHLGLPFMECPAISGEWSA